VIIIGATNQAQAGLVSILVAVFLAMLGTLPVLLTQLILRIALKDAIMLKNGGIINNE
jgi:hypothetical protein